MTSSFALRTAHALVCLSLLATPALANEEATSNQATPTQARVQVHDGPLAALQAPDRDAVTEFYAARGDAPFWTDADQDRLPILLAATDNALAHGLPAARYDAEAILNAPDASHRELAAMSLYLKWARDLTTGVLTPRAVDPEIDVDKPTRTAAQLLAPLEAPDIADALLALQPDDPEYALLVADLDRLSELAAKGGWGATIVEGDTLRLGDADARVPAIRTRLTALGYPSETAANTQLFDTELERAVMAFQRSAGLVDDGVAGKRTITELNTSPEDRQRQVMVNLERLRWMNGRLGDRYIVANIPDFSARMVDGGVEVWRSRAVVGKADDTRTPEFSDEMTYMVANPTWHVPKSISTKVFLPKLQKDPSLFHRQGMQLMTRSGTEVNPRLVDFQAFTVDDFPFVIKQKPSDDNALGLVKFMFPNQHAIYLHDTPSKSLFGKDARAFSNGCIRLEQPFDLAHALLNGQVDDPSATFSAWIDRKTERRVDLSNPVPVHLVYRTVFTDENGDVVYRGDIYGRDAVVFRALQDAGLTLNTAQG